MFDKFLKKYYETRDVDVRAAQSNIRRASGSWLGKMKHMGLGEMNEHAQECLQTLDAIVPDSTQEGTMLMSLKKELVLFCAARQDVYDGWLSYFIQGLDWSVSEGEGFKKLGEMMWDAESRKSRRGHEAHFYAALKDYVLNKASVQNSGRPLYCRSQNEWKD